MNDGAQLAEVKKELLVLCESKESQLRLGFYTMELTCSRTLLAQHTAKNIHILEFFGENISLLSYTNIANHFDLFCQSEPHTQYILYQVVARLCWSYMKSAMSEIVFPVIDYEMSTNGQICLSKDTKVNSDDLKCLAKTLNPKDKQIANIENQTIYSGKQQFNDWLID